MNAVSIQKKVDSAFRRVGGMDRKVYIRSYAVDPSQDSLIGRSADVTAYTDALITPQPTYRQLSKRDIVYLTQAGNKVGADDYKIDISPLAISDDVLKNPTTMFVLKDSASEQVLRIVYPNSMGLGGKTVLYSVIARSVDNTA